LVSGLRTQKGLPTLLDALELLHARGTPVRFAIVGNGPLEDEVRRRIAGGPLRGTTLLAPFDGSVARYLNALDGFVLPSYWEGLSLAVLEAMHAGLAVIATAVGGTPEAVVDRETGLLVPRSDPVALADALTLLADDPALRRRMGEAGQRRARERFGVDRMVDATAELYRACAAHARR
jgi:glycosyltransferase involved in cell wall biosynthesis